MSQLLEAELRREIAEHGPISFQRFMELALYHPEEGYYATKDPFGTAGDFYTSSDAGAVFAETVVDFMVRTASDFGIPFRIVECGAGDGRFARHALEYVRDRYPEHQAVGIYTIVEIAARRKEKLREALQPFGDMVHFATVDKLSAWEGFVFANELYDAMPVRIVTQTPAGMAEVFVCCNRDGGFTEVLRPPEMETQTYLRRFRPTVPEGARCELHTAASRFYEQICQKGRRGILLTVDYGYFEENQPFRPGGTLRTFFRHHVGSELYRDVGEKDITADVNFSVLLEIGRQYGFTRAWWGTQSQFLLRAGILDKVRITASPMQSFRRIQAVKPLILPGAMGDAFTVLLQAKGLRNAQTFPWRGEDRGLVHA